MKNIGNRWLWLTAALLAACSDGSLEIESGGAGGLSTRAGAGGTAGASADGLMSTGSSGRDGSEVGRGGSGGAVGPLDDGSIDQSDANQGDASGVDRLDANQRDASRPEIGADGLRRGPFKMLVVSETLEYHHATIPDGIQMLRDLGNTSDADLMQIGAPAGSQWTVDVANADFNSPDYLSEFTAERLASYEMVYSDNPSGEVFSAPSLSQGPAAKAAFESFMLSGGAWAGHHSATDFEHYGRWAWFQDQVNGAWDLSENTDGIQGTITWQPNAATHPILRGLDNPWNVVDQWLVMNRNIESVPGFQVLANVTLADAGPPRPVIWIHELDGGGRAFYTVRGHGHPVYVEPMFRKLIQQGILWAVHRLN